MAQWRCRDPGSFPMSFHDAMKAGEGKDKVAAQRDDLKAIRFAQVQWQIFRFSVRHFPLHPCYYWENRLLHRTRIAFNEQRQVWELLLTSRKRVLEDLIGMS